MYLKTLKQLDKHKYGKYIQKTVKLPKGVNNTVAKWNRSQITSIFPVAMFSKAACGKSLNDVWVKCLNFKHTPTVHKLQVMTNEEHSEEFIVEDYKGDNQIQIEQVIKVRRQWALLWLYNKRL